MKGTAEATVRSALRSRGLFVYKPPDDARNWKPCDFLTWEPSNTGWPAYCRWIEVKTVPASARTLGADELRPSQLSGVAEALRLNIPYWLIVRWNHPMLASWTCVELTEMQHDAKSWRLSLPYSDDVWARKGGLLEVVAAMID